MKSLFVLVIGLLRRGSSPAADVLRAAVVTIVTTACFLARSLAPWVASAGLQTAEARAATAGCRLSCAKNRKTPPTGLSLASSRPERAAH